MADPLGSVNAVLGVERLFSLGDGWGLVEKEFWLNDPDGVLAAALASLGPGEEPEPAEFNVIIRTNENG
jgi:hypothetical protein